jgi:hypothetical protein
MYGGCVPDRLLLIPQKSRETVQDATALTIPFDGGSLEVFVARSPGAKQAEPKAYMLEFTGNATAADDIAGLVASRWGERPVETWVMNYPGYGHSTGKARLARIGPAGLAVYDELKKVAGDKPIVLAGNSMGTTVALYVATQRPTAGLILQSPPPLMKCVMIDNGWWNLWLLAAPVALALPTSLNSIANAARVTVPAIFITCDSDTLVKPGRQKLIIDAYAGPKRLIVLQGKNHNDLLERRDELAEFGEGLDWLLPSVALTTPGQPNRLAVANAWPTPPTTRP